MSNFEPVPIKPSRCSIRPTRPLSIAPAAVVALLLAVVLHIGLQPSVHTLYGKATFEFSTHLQVCIHLSSLPNRYGFQIAVACKSYDE